MTEIAGERKGEWGCGEMRRFGEGGGVERGEHVERRRDGQ